MKNKRSGSPKEIVNIQIIDACQINEIATNEHFSSNIEIKSLEDLKIDIKSNYADFSNIKITDNLIIKLPDSIVVFYEKEIKITEDSEFYLICHNFKSTPLLEVQYRKMTEIFTPPVHNIAGQIVKNCLIFEKPSHVKIPFTIKLF